MRGASGLSLSAALAIAVVLGVVCGDSPPDEVAVPGVEEEPASIAPDEELPVQAVAPGADPAVGDTVAVGDAGGSVAVLATEADVNAGALFAAGRGKEYFAVQVRGCSGPTERGLSFEAGYFLLEMTDHSFANSTLPIKRPQLDGGEVPAGGCLEGWVTFTIPKKAKPAFVLYDGSNRLKWRIPTEEPGGSGR